MSVDDKPVLGAPPDDGSWFYKRQEGFPMRAGLGVMWDSTSKGFMLRIGQWYVWCRWSVRAKKLFLKGGKIHREEFGHETIGSVDGKAYKDGKWEDSSL